MLSSANQALQARVSGLEDQLQQSAARYQTLQTQVISNLRSQGSVRLGLMVVCTISVVI